MPLRLRSLGARGAAQLIAHCALVCFGASGCVRTVQAWPPPLTDDASVTVRFAAPRIIMFAGTVGRDSAAGVRELEGRVVYLRGNTLVVSVTHAPEGTDGGRMVGRPATILLDSATTVTRTEVDGWKVGYGILATAVLIFAGLVLWGGG